MASNIKKTFFQIKWFLMPEKAKYAYLWEQTRDNYERQLSTLRVY